MGVGTKGFTAPVCCVIVASSGGIAKEGLMRRLRWRVHELIGASSVGAAQWDLRIYRASLDPILAGTAQQVTLFTLARLVRGLSLESAGPWWLTVRDPSGAVSLHWRTQLH